MHAIETNTSLAMSSSGTGTALLPIVHQAIARLNDYLPREQQRAILLAGSYATGTQDRFSDLDFLVVTDTATGSAAYRLNDIEVEAPFHTEEFCRRSLTTPSPDHNNYILNTLCTAMIVIDSQDAGRSLIHEARKVFASKPESPSSLERSRASRALERLSCSARRYAARAESDPAAAGFARMRIDMLFSRSVYLFCWAEGRRTSALPSLCRSLIAEQSDAGDLVQAYLHNDSFHERVSLAQKICTLALDRLCCNNRV